MDQGRDSASTQMNHNRDTAQDTTRLKKMKFRQPRLAHPFKERV